MEENETIELTYQQPKLSRIFSSHLFDFFSTLAFSLLLFSLFVLVLHKIPVYSDSLTNQEEIQHSSRLYVREDHTVSLLVDFLDRDDTLSTKEKSLKLSSSLSYFFDEFLKENSKVDDPDVKYTSLLKETKDDSGRDLFDDDRDAIYSNDDENENYYKAYSTIFRRYAIGYLSYVNGYSELSKVRVLSTLVTFVLSLSASYLLFFLLFPCVFHKGRKTLGMKMSRIGYVALTGYNPTKGRYALYLLLEWLFVFLASFVTFGIPLFISVGMMFISKNHQTLMEYVSGMIPIDDENSRIYDNEIDYQNHNGIGKEDGKNGR